MEVLGRTAAIVSGVAFSPRMAIAGSPGSRSSRAAVPRLTRSSTGTSCSSRIPRKRIGLPFGVGGRSAVGGRTVVAWWHERSLSGKHGRPGRVVAGPAPDVAGASAW